ncbi:MAG: hypothetical protein OQJ89_06265 [Kangiellaceae bacterium]|nr:hypothetical protein [Kangiellaceae bacterium]MCW9016546.1 hypothetical protein [Kangiellaceae bacterium]
MILSIQIEKISDFLATLSPLMDMYKDGNYSFASRAIDWLEEAEKLMSSLRLKEGAEMSSLRAQILKAGDIAKDDHGARTRSAIRRACCAAAADSVTRAESILRNRILQAEDKLNHFEEKLCEAVTAAVLVDCFTHSPREPRQQWLMKVWQELSQHNSIRPTTVYLATALLSVDRLYLLDKIMARLYENDAAVIHETPTPPLAN